MRTIDEFAAVLRERSVDLPNEQLLISVLQGSDQESDLSEPAVCEGLGRVRHFRSQTSAGWPVNPLPIVPAARWLGYRPAPDSMRALVYQNAVCNWRCWYCFVPFNLLAGHLNRSRWVTAEQLVGLYQSLPRKERPSIIDLSGGQPDLIPEWSMWMFRAIREAGLDREVYLWGDDNLSNDYLFRYLSDADISELAMAPNYGRVCCLKGFDAMSFAFNTSAPAEHFERQFDILRRLCSTGIDIYCYATFTTPSMPRNPEDGMRRFLDRLQSIDELLPLRLIPLEIAIFGPVGPRMRSEHEHALKLQVRMVTAWQRTLAERFNAQQRGTAIVDIPLSCRATLTQGWS